MILAITLLLMCWNGAKVTGITVTIDVDYSAAPPDFVGGPNDYRAASSVILTCEVTGTGAVTHQWTSSLPEVKDKPDTRTRTNLRSTDSGNHTCTVSGGMTGSATIEINVVGAGIFVNRGSDSVPIGVLPNNGIVIARNSGGDRFNFQCRSGSLVTGVGQLVDLDENTFNIGNNSGVFIVEQTGTSGHPGSVLFRNRVGIENALTAADEGVYSCRIPDEGGSDVDVNIGVYGNGFNTPPSVSSLTYDCGTRTLTCTSTCSPATTVTWTKDGVTLPVDGTTYNMTQTLADRRASTYENVLTLPATGDIKGNYSCQVGNALGSHQTTISPLQVEITTTGGDTVAGEQYTLTCTVTVPESSGLSVTPTVVWTGDEGKTGVTEGIPETLGRVTTSTLTFNQLQDSQDGMYTCMATFSCRGVTDQTASGLELDVVAPEVRVTAIATSGAPIVGGTSYSLTCDHDAPSSLMATVQSTLTTPGGTMLTSLPHTFNPLLVTDGGQYRCTATVSSPYLTVDFTATQGTPLDVVVEIPDPVVTVTSDGSETLYAGSLLTLTCTITLGQTLSSMLSDLSVTSTWAKSDSTLTSSTNRVVSPAMLSGGTFSGTVMFNTLLTSDTGGYSCRTTVTPRDTSKMAFTTGGEASSQTVMIRVQTPTLMVSLEPNTTRLPTEPPYNTFTITCTATAPEGVVAGKTIEWKRRIGSSTTGLSEITDNGNTIQIMTTNPNQPETTSVLTVTETTPGDYRYRCRVDITELGSVSQMTKDVYPIDVIGPIPPVKTTNLMNISTSSDSATIQWTVPQIAFTPETYVVHYGTTMGSLNLMSDPVESGDDFEAENTLFTVQLNGLHPGTMYYYQVSTTNSNASTLSDIELFQTGDQRIPGIPGPPGNDGNRGPPGDTGPPGSPGERGEDGEHGPTGPPGAQGPKGQKGSRGGVGGLIGVGPIGRPGEPGLRGPSGSRGSKGDPGDPGQPGGSGPPGEEGRQGRQGVSYTHWGGGFCPNSTLLLYSGYGVSSGSDLLCLTSNTQCYEEDTPSPDGLSEVVTVTNISCAVCYAADKATVFALPGSTVCPEGWNTEYNGYLVAGPFEGSQHICIAQSPETLMNILTGAILPTTVTGSQSHPMFEAGRQLTCSVCSS